MFRWLVVMQELPYYLFCHRLKNSLTRWHLIFSHNSMSSTVCHLYNSFSFNVISQSHLGQASMLVYSWWSQLSYRSHTERGNGSCWGTPFSIFLVFCFFKFLLSIGLSQHLFTILLNLDGRFSLINIASIRFTSHASVFHYITLPSPFPIPLMI